MPKKKVPSLRNANDDESKGVIMGVRHKEYTVEGVQFHPESVLSCRRTWHAREFPSHARGYLGRVIGYMEEH